MYEDLSHMMFVNGYLEVLIGVDHDTKVHMLSHLQEPIADGEAYGGPVVQAYMQHRSSIWSRARPCGVTMTPS